MELPVEPLSCLMRQFSAGMLHHLYQHILQLVTMFLLLIPLGKKLILGL